jgi:hypothetical protein
MAHYCLGNQDLARLSFNTALARTKRQGPLTEGQTKELGTFRAETESVLAGVVEEMPDDVFDRGGRDVRINASPR